MLISEKLWVPYIHVFVGVKNIEIVENVVEYFLLGRLILTYCPNPNNLGDLFKVNLNNHYGSTIIRAPRGIC